MLLMKQYPWITQVPVCRKYGKSTIAIPKLEISSLNHYNGLIVIFLKYCIQLVVHNPENPYFVVDVKKPV